MIVALLIPAHTFGAQPKLDNAMISSCINEKLSEKFIQHKLESSKRLQAAKEHEEAYQASNASNSIMQAKLSLHLYNETETQPQGLQQLFGSVFMQLEALQKQNESILALLAAQNKANQSATAAAQVNPATATAAGPMAIAVAKK